MKALRIKLHQTSANYRREETIYNKMTYPLPPLSTVIGALHVACGYREYHEMQVSIQGKYESMQKKVYKDYCFLNSVMDDRGILVKMRNENFLSTAYDVVATAKKSQGNSFLKGITIQVVDENLMREYRDLKATGEKISEWKKSEEYTSKVEDFKGKKKLLDTQKKKLDKKSSEYKGVVEQLNRVKQEEKEWKQSVADYEQEAYKKPIAKYRSLTTSVKYYEILNNVELILHICADEETMDDIYQNIYNLKSLGRSEDFVDVEEIKYVELINGYENEITSEYSAYLKYQDIKNKSIFTEKYNQEVHTSGTKYYLGKKYELQNGQRIFTEKIPVLYASQYANAEEDEDVWVDTTDVETSYIVSLL